MTNPTLSVKNFDQFQHYRDRKPPWIKLYYNLLDDYEFAALPDASKMHLIAIWLLASRNSNKIPYDIVWISRRINATEKLDLGTLVDAGFLIENQPLQRAEQDASKPQAKSSLEKEKETLTNVSVRRTPKSELCKVLDEERAVAVIEHRKRLKAPLTSHAAKLLVGKFSKWHDPEAAADAMVGNGWRGFEPEWMENRIGGTSNKSESGLLAAIGRMERGEEIPT